MSAREDALRGLRKLTEPEYGAPATPSPADLSPARLQGLTFKPGDSVVDSITGQEGEVIHAEFVRGPAPPA